MSALDELRGTLSNTICNASNYTKRAQPHLLGSDMSVVLDKTADAILAAGYRKPRTITTVDELIAMPDMSSVLDAMDGPLTRFGSWWRAADGAQFHSMDIVLPATVLHDPEATP